ncbi:P-loop containing nucleoside triphosphate hydrolase protein [Lentinus brumalis]|uniref:P-loop containing nucleoside triphosphate hydrolase protein n=1 Tax=Lentinus brumalis TaxID=2498619 RepID=A0A371DTL4_9APHY|nr:P-loop containing nucleoside triphosphate hydrolase protein [Polyporus brumalis]
MSQQERYHPRSNRGGAGSSLLARAHKNNVSSGGRGGRKKQRESRFPIVPGPLHDEQYITTTYRTKPLKKAHESNPKSPLSNYITSTGEQMNFQTSQVIVDGNDQAVWRSTVTVKHENGDITGVGDSANRKAAENLAALSALYQLDARGALEKKKEEPAPLETTLSDGTVVNYEQARHFMDYYCRRFRFAKPDIVYAQPTRGPWQADMIVGDRRIGFGKGANKKDAMMRCYTDVVQYLEKCDPEIWQEFLRDVKTGKDLGMAPTVLLQADDVLQDKIDSLKEDIKRSSLYRNRPTIRATKDGDQVQQNQAASSYRRPPASEALLREKSQQLQTRRQAYLTNPELESIRNTRASLPVFTKSEELLKHVDEHDVTICMAATGSGKTTQIPQLLLDQWIDRGEGAKCNIICTQPRRIAAISVAERVAKERGESCGGRGTVGYQVRFESKLPEDHGSITYCTTGVFLRKMQSALMETSSRRSMDEVTHIIVDEVHERDVDIDLMLVVLKRLLAERRAQNKPIKIVLMSATIDSTLFRNYFPDQQGNPAGVVEIPGRAYPVEKHFLDDFVPQLSSDPQTSWVFREESVRKYLRQELGHDAPGVPPSLSSSRAPTPVLREHTRDTDDLELPVPLIALTIAHVLKRSQDGHVLVFLPGWDDISAVRRALTESDRSKTFGFNFSDTSKFSIHLLHSSIPVAEQQAIFDPPPAGVRRIILSTNIAETSVTIPDVVYVIDTARIKEQRYDPSRHISNLVSAWVGSSNLNQRAGRAGRHRPGEYFGILSREHAEHLQPHQTVEMKRVDLENVVMHVKALNFPGMTIEEVLAATIEPPAPERIEAAIQSLHMVGALDPNNNLTSLGSVLLQLPVDPRLGRLVLFGSFFRCLDSALTLAAMMGAREPFVAPMHLKAEAQAKKNSWTPEEFRSDLLAALRAYREWWALQSQGHYVSANRFCSDNFLSKPTLMNIAKVKDHLLKALYDVGVVDVSAGGKLPYVPPGVRRREIPPLPQQLNENGDSLPLLAGLIAIACQPKFAIRTGERTYRTAVDKVVIIHPSSVNHRKREMPHGGDHPHIEKQIVAYAEKRQNISTSQGGEKYLVATTRLDPLTYILFGAYRIAVTQRGLECDEWLPVIGRPDVLDDLERLKVMMEDCMLRVFQGIIATRQRKAQFQKKPLTYEEGREDESGDEEEDDLTNVPLTDTEMKDLDLMTMDLVRILKHYSSYRVAIQSRSNSRPGTPMDSPSLLSSRLPFTPYSGGSRSGYSTPHHVGSAYSSRPSTPSRLSRR